jgi:glioma pathogenesis-related protein 2
MKLQMIRLVFTGLISATLLATFHNRLVSSGESTLDLAILRRSILTEHNTYRSKHYSPKLTTSNSLDKNAQDWANHLAIEKIFEHSDNLQVGENIYVSYDHKLSVNAKTLAENVVNFWYSEVANYNYMKPGFSDNTGHFTQVIWKNSLELGCGAARGTVFLEGKEVGAFYVVCQYSPAGNSSRQFATNVLKP